MRQPISSERRLAISERVEVAHSTFPHGRRVPMIRLRGKWLEENGFIAGERVVVNIERGRIVLTLAGEVR